MKKVSVLGLGYIGLPTALLLARGGLTVQGFDVDQRKLDLLSAGKLPFEETGLEELFAEAAANSTFSKTLTPADVYIIAVPTPVTNDHRCDLSYVESAARAVAQLLKRGDLVVLESTVRPGTTEDVLRPILEESGLSAGSDFLLSYVSEKAIPGSTIREMIHNDRIIGGIDEQSRQATKELYEVFVKGDLFLTNCKTAETVKLVENAYRDVNIAFANEIATVASRIGVNAWDVINLANRHPRVHVHSPGPGVGGHCIALDPWFLIEQDFDATRLMQEARKRNDAMPHIVADGADRLAKKYGTKTIGVLGVAYKKDVDDARETPALPIIESLEGRGYSVIVYDPHVQQFERPLVSLDRLVNEAEAFVLVTDHARLREIPILPAHRWMLDTRAMFRDEKFPESMEYVMLGTPVF